MSLPLKPIPVIDGFAHIDDPLPPRELESFRSEQRRAGIRKWCFAGSNFCRALGVADQNPLGLWLKRRLPQEVYFFASAASFAEEAPAEGEPPPQPLERQVKALAAAGADGWKMMNGKPDRARTALNAPEYRPFFEALQDRGLPLRWHVGDPIEFWDPEGIPKWAKREWCYGPQHPRLEQLRDQAQDVLRTFPGLVVIFTHFFFLGDELERAGEMLGRYPNAHLDLTPGVEMYFWFSGNRERAREFFTEHSDRILLGSYTSPGRPPGPVVTMIRRFLETEESFDPPHGDPFMWPETRGPMLGLGLEDEALEDIYWRNWERIVGASPATLDEAAAHEYLAKWRPVAPERDLARKVLSSWDPKSR
jgi:predicted TIM-barrel fold metal-dependent hydrolase